MLKCKIFYDSSEEGIEQEFNKFCKDNALTAKQIVKIEYRMTKYDNYSIALFYDDVDLEEFLNSIVPPFDPLMNRAQDETIFYQTYPTSSR